MQKLWRGLQEGKTVKLCDRSKIPQTEFSCQGRVILRAGKVVIPRHLRNRILGEVHAEHPGIIRAKALARKYCWWPGIDRDHETMISECINCNTVRNNPPKSVTEEWEPAEFPFQRIHIDYAGPFLQHYFLITVDARSKWPEVRITKDMTSETTIRECKQVFATFGIPEVLVSDNGRRFVSKEFTEFVNLNGIKHKRTAPFHPATNGQAERFVQTFKQVKKTISMRMPK